MQNIYFGKIFILPTMLATRLMWKPPLPVRGKYSSVSGRSKEGFKMQHWLLIAKIFKM